MRCARLFAFGIGLFALAATAELPAAEDTASNEQLLARYAFDDYGRQPISFYYCQAGFHLSGYKPIYVWTRQKFADGRAELAHCRTGKSYPIPLECHGVNLWGRQEWVADCTNIADEGRYVLHVEFGDLKAETMPFPIRRACYDELREKAAKHYFLKRCGIFCHTHDATLYSLQADDFGRVIDQVPAYGGWHDAHDDNKWVAFTWAPVYGLLKTQERFAPDWRQANEPYPYCLSEAWWEVDWLLRMQKPDGSFYSGVFEWFPTEQDGRTILRVHHREQNYDDLHRDQRAVLDVWGENAICDALGRKHNTAPSTAPKYFAYVAHVLRCCGRLIKSYDAEKAGRCNAAARRAVDYLEGIETYPPYQELEVHAALALYYLEDARDGGGPAALTKAEAYLRRVLSQQQAEGHFHASDERRGLEFYPEEAGDDRVFVDYPFAYMTPLIEYLEFAEQNEQACKITGQVRQSVRRFAEMLAGFCEANAFRHPTEIRFDRKPAVIIPPHVAKHGYNPYILSAGVVFAAADRLAGFSGGCELAQRQLHWVLGANPRFMSFMNQLGVRNSGQYAASSSVSAEHYPMAFYRHLRDMRWGVTVGIYGPMLKRTTDPTAPIEYAQPPNYPNAGSAALGRYNHVAQETWLNCNGWLLLLLAEFEP